MIPDNQDRDTRAVSRLEVGCVRDVHVLDGRDRPTRRGTDAQLLVEEVLGLVADAASIASIDGQRHSRGAVLHGVADSRPRYNLALRPRSSVDRAAPS